MQKEEAVNKQQSAIQLLLVVPAGELTRPGTAQDAACVCPAPASRSPESATSMTCPRGPCPAWRGVRRSVVDVGVCGLGFQAHPVSFLTCVGSGSKAVSRWSSSGAPSSAEQHPSRRLHHGLIHTSQSGFSAWPCLLLAGLDGAWVPKGWGWARVPPFSKVRGRGEKTSWCQLIPCPCH